MLAECNCDAIKRQRRLRRLKFPRASCSLRPGCSARSLYPESHTSSTPKHGALAHVVRPNAALTCSLPPGRAVQAALATLPDVGGPGHASGRRICDVAADGAIFLPWPLTRATSRACSGTSRVRARGTAALSARRRRRVRVAVQKQRQRRRRRQKRPPASSAPRNPSRPESRPPLARPPRPSRRRPGPSRRGPAPPTPSRAPSGSRGRWPRRA